MLVDPEIFGAGYSMPVASEISGASSMPVASEISGTSYFMPVTSEISGQ